ncbi:hypothetical protein [Nocardioides sp. CFH 31398]|uniref:hypothetical protein n=1 Tax=Nocardioides sp. CFH 31398 TaxID=2919579 RepID=UPI001F05B500|nr:hypothetical protein [Nocardioides sp. CFH 31398]MCH1866173.1 hypothetical protein [Nocardioides sp. CFH 31398]
MARLPVQRDDLPGSWCLDALLAGMLLAASAAWAGVLAGGAVMVDLTLAGSFLVASLAFAWRAVRGRRREHRRPDRWDRWDR